MHGLQANEMSDLRSALHDAKTHSCHPLLVPSLLCQLLVDSDANSIRKHAADLYQVEVKTNYHGFYATEIVICIGDKLFMSWVYRCLGTNCICYRHAQKHLHFSNNRISRLARRSRRQKKSSRTSREA